MRGAESEQARAENGPPVSIARLNIPTGFESSDDYRARIGRLLGEVGTCVYIDTSFLMWATKIGPASRGELLEWLRTDVGDRAHVPTWAAHEYLRHHVAGTIVDELAKKTTEISQLAGGTFNYFRPFLDDPALPAADSWGRLRSSTRDAINTLGLLATATKKWKDAYPAHAQEIIEYINERVLAVGTLFEDLPAIAELGAARYEGRIPPGYQDRNKKGQTDDDPDEVSVAGANRYGDLIFWKESMEHAAAMGASAVIILTNDRKNDWRMGGTNHAEIDATMLSIKKAWRPVPVIHPMLALEAQLSGVGEVALIDSQYLAAYLRGVDASRVGAFADVAIVPDPPAVPTEKDNRQAAVARREAADAMKVEQRVADALAQAADDGFRFADDPAVGSTRRALTTALLRSRDGADDRGAAILDRVRANVGASERFADLLTADEVAGMDHVALAKLARALHDRVVAGDPGYGDALVDLIGLLDELPHATAGAIYLGLLASMYLEPAAGTSRIPPESPAATMLIERLGRPFADIAASVIAKRLLGNDRYPLFVPTEEAVDAAFDIETEGGEADQLRSLKINGVETLAVAQDNPAYRLRDLLGAETATGAAILALAAGLFSIPLTTVDAHGDGASEYLITETIGFRTPDQLARTKEEE
jgi:hypothetical protein